VLTRSYSRKQGIDPTVDYKKVLKAFKKEFCCNGTVVEDPEQARARERRLRGAQAPLRAALRLAADSPARCRLRGM
jgi:hypothetical protein